MVITFTGHKLHYICDNEVDINSSMAAGSHVYVSNSDKNYTMRTNGTYGITSQVQADFTQTNNTSLDYIKNKPAPVSHIADASANAPTNLGGLLLAALSTEINATNVKQNDLANKFNSLLRAVEGWKIVSS